MEVDRASSAGTGGQDEEQLRKDLSQVNPLMQDWFDVGALREKMKAGKGQAIQDSETESETEPEDDPESENEDVRGEPDIVDDDDWEAIEKESQSDDKVSTIPKGCAVNSHWSIG